jgi:hypothetical protein
LPSPRIAFTSHCLYLALPDCHRVTMPAPCRHHAGMRPCDSRHCRYAGMLPGDSRHCRYARMLLGLHTIALDVRSSRRQGIGIAECGIKGCRQCGDPRRRGAELKYSHFPWCQIVGMLAAPSHHTPMGVWCEMVSRIAAMPVAPLRDGAHHQKHRLPVAKSP